MDKFNKNKIIRAGIFVLLVLVFEHVFSFLNFPGIFTYLLPIAFVLYNYDLKFKEAAIVMLGVMLVSLSASLNISLYVIFISAPLGLFFHYAFKNKWYSSKTILYSTGIAVIGVCLIVATVSFVLETNVVAIFKDTLKEVSLNNEIVNIVSSSTGMQTSEVTRQIQEVFMSTLASNIVILLSLYVFTMHKLLYWLLRLYKKSIKKYSKLSEFRLPKSLPFGTLVIMALSWLSSDVLKIVSDDILTNVVILVLSVFSIQALAVLSHMLNKIRVKGVFQIPIIVLVVFMVQFFALGLIGWADVMIDFRKISDKLGNISRK